MSTESAGVALVTGAGKGIGLETARRLAGAGYRVYLTAREYVSVEPVNGNAHIAEERLLALEEDSR